MPGPDLIVLISSEAPAAVFAYGPVPGVELIPYFLALLAWVGLACAGILWAPFAALWRRLRKSRSDTDVSPPMAPPQNTVP